ncbi:MAG: hypothetical protein R3A80_10495 [Bdellovibrionota bacterium]
MPAINITFTAKPRVLENTLAEEVEDTNAKAPTFFAVGDLVTKVNGQAITSNYAIRKNIFSLWTTGKKSLPVEVIRGGKTLTFNEPILEVKNDWSVERVSSLNNLYRP